MGKLYGGADQSQNHNFTPGIRLLFKAPTTQLIYLKIQNKTAGVYGANVAYYLAVRQLVANPEFGAVIIVAGKYQEADLLQTNIHNVTDRVHRLFVDQGYSADENIYYLATDMSLTGVDGLATQANLQKAITEWVVSRVGPTRALTFRYRDEDVINLDEQTLKLRYWDGQSWSEDGITLLSHDRDNNVMQFTLSHLSEFALFGQHVSNKTGVYLPIVIKK